MNKPTLNILAIALSVLLVGCKKQINPVTFHFFDIETGEGISGVRVSYLDGSGIILGSYNEIIEESNYHGIVELSGQNFLNETVYFDFHGVNYVPLEYYTDCSGLKGYSVDVQHSIYLLGCIKQQYLKVNQINKSSDIHHCISVSIIDSCELWSNWELLPDDSTSFTIPIVDLNKDIKIDINTSKCEHTNNLKPDTSITIKHPFIDTTEVTLDFSRF